MKSLFIPIMVISSLVTLTSCKTTEEIRREQMVDGLSKQVVQSQRLSADVTVRVQNLEEQVTAIQGTLETTAHDKKEKLDATTKKLDEEIKLQEKSREELYKRVENSEKIIASIELRLKEQQEYLDKLLKTLSDLTDVKPAKKKKGKNSKESEVTAAPVHTGGTFDSAIGLYKKGKYAESKEILLGLLEAKKLNKDQKPHALHNLGMIEYTNKKYDTALSYFSKLYSEFDKSSLLPNALYFMAKCLDAKGQKADALASLEELKSKFPKSSRWTKDGSELYKKLSK